MQEETLHKLPTYNEGLDEILCGGFPMGRVSAICGGPGAGKSVMALESAVKNAENGIAVLFFSFEQTQKNVLADAAAFNWPVYKLLKTKALDIQSGNLDHAEQNGESDILAGLFIQILAAIKEHNVKMVILDALDILLGTLPSPEYLKQLRVFCNELCKQDIALILTVKKDDDQLEKIDFLVDCVILLDQRVKQQVTTRRLRVSKYRGSPAFQNEYPFIIGTDGITILPLSRTKHQNIKLGGFVKTGIDRFDDMLGGGFKKGSCILVAGTPGTAKTTLASSFSKYRCSKDECVLYLDLEQSMDGFLDNVLSAGIDLSPHIKKGNFKHFAQMPEATGPEEHLVQVFNLIDEHKPDHIIVDAISAFGRMGGESVAFDYTLRLIDHCKSRGITAVLTNQTNTFMDISQLSGIEISSMVDTVVGLNFLQSGAELNRVMLVLKARGACNSNQFREFTITDHGLEILDVCLEQDGKLLTGTARQAVEEQTQATRMVKNNRIQQLESEILSLRLEIAAEDKGRETRKAMRDMTTPIINNGRK